MRPFSETSKMVNKRVDNEKAMKEKPIESDVIQIDSLLQQQEAFATALIELVYREEDNPDHTSYFNQINGNDLNNIHKKMLEKRLDQTPEKIHQLNSTNLKGILKQFNNNSESKTLNLLWQQMIQVSENDEKCVLCDAWVDDIRQGKTDLLESIHRIQQLKELNNNKNKTTKRSKTKNDGNVSFDKMIDQLFGEDCLKNLFNGSTEEVKNELKICYSFSPNSELLEVCRNNNQIDIQKYSERLIEAYLGGSIEPKEDAVKNQIASLIPGARLDVQIKQLNAILDKLDEGSDVDFSLVAQGIDEISDKEVGNDLKACYALGHKNDKDLLVSYCSALNQEANQTSHFKTNLKKVTIASVQAFLDSPSELDSSKSAIVKTYITENFLLIISDQYGSIIFDAAEKIVKFINQNAPNAASPVISQILEKALPSYLDRGTQQDFNNLLTALSEEKKKSKKDHFECLQEPLKSTINSYRALIDIAKCLKTSVDLPKGKTNTSLGQQDMKVALDQRISVLSEKLSVENIGSFVKIKVKNNKEYRWVINEINKKLLITGSDEVLQKIFQNIDLNKAFTLINECQESMPGEHCARVLSILLSNISSENETTKTLAGISVNQNTNDEEFKKTVVKKLEKAISFKEKALSGVMIYQNSEYREHLFKYLGLLVKGKIEQKKIGQIDQLFQSTQTGQMKGQFQKYVWLLSTFDALSSSYPVNGRVEKHEKSEKLKNKTEKNKGQLNKKNSKTAINQHALNGSDSNVDQALNSIQENLIDQVTKENIEQFINSVTHQSFPTDLRDALLSKLIEKSDVSKISKLVKQYNVNQLNETAMKALVSKFNQFKVYDLVNYPDLVIYTHHTNNGVKAKINDLMSEAESSLSLDDLKKLISPLKQAKKLDQKNINHLINKLIMKEGVSCLDFLKTQSISIDKHMFEHLFIHGESDLIKTLEVLKKEDVAKGYEFKEFLKGEGFVGDRYLGPNLKNSMNLEEAIQVKEILGDDYQFLIDNTDSEFTDYVDAVVSLNDEKYDHYLTDKLNDLTFDDKKYLVAQLDSRNGPAVNARINKQLYPVFESYIEAKKQIEVSFNNLKNYSNEASKWGITVNQSHKINNATNTYAERRQLVLVSGQDIVNKELGLLQPNVPLFRDLNQIKGHLDQLQLSDQSDKQTVKYFDVQVAKLNLTDPNPNQNQPQQNRSEEDWNKHFANEIMNALGLGLKESGNPELDWETISDNCKQNFKANVQSIKNGLDDIEKGLSGTKCTHSKDKKLTDESKKAFYTTILKAANTQDATEYTIKEAVDNATKQLVTDNKLGEHKKWYTQVGRFICKNIIANLGIVVWNCATLGKSEASFFRLAPRSKKLAHEKLDSLKTSVKTAPAA
jgi:hypothetical protein